MSMFKRADWHSGLTYRVVCEHCKAEVTYQDNILDFRPWYADGFIYCPRCNQPIRHSERYAINAMQDCAVDLTTEPFTPAESNGEESVFCANCGKKFQDGDRFCSGCGSKR